MTSSDEGGLIAGRYRLESELGRGAMGVVWLARDERLGRMVAVKELRGRFGLSSTQVEQTHLRARREARIAARLHHESAVAVYDVAEHDGEPYLVMEYVRSRSLSETLAQDGVLEPAQAAEIGVQLASALAAAHEAGIVHRDVKPGNILLTEHGKAKLTDFGISRAVGDVTVTGTGEMLGTPAYVAPEVAQGRPATAASDVFSLGATLYAAVEGMPPFETGPTVMALLLRIVNGEMRPPERCGPLAGPLLWMMQPDPLNRPGMERARRALQAAAVEAPNAPAAEPVSTLPEPAAQPESAPEAADAAAHSDAVADRGEPADASAPERPKTTTFQSGRRRMLPFALMAVAAVLTAGIVAGIVASSGPNTSHDEGPSQSPTHSPSATHSAAGASATEAASATSVTPAAPTTSASQSVSAQLVSAIADYYKLMPGHLDEGWGYLTPAYQVSPAGGMSGYRGFWGQVKSVAATDIVASPPSTVVATITYHFKNGQVETDRTTFGLVRSGGIWKIATSHT
ncbi:serine/threonine-protein kinase [Actinospica robiniae]|uniref:serine/threonine-protein kinase n=1 Tax=Actinospica robiniae TaxID=304901 RepID=UPI00041FAEF6|nr:serine/threonine-protein kinase [Actinospica robiniae]